MVFCSSRKSVQSPLRSSRSRIILAPGVRVASSWLPVLTPHSCTVLVLTPSPSTKHVHAFSLYLGFLPPGFLLYSWAPFEVLSSLCMQCLYSKHLMARHMVDAYSILSKWMKLLVCCLGRIIYNEHTKAPSYAFSDHIFITLLICQ